MSQLHLAVKLTVVVLCNAIGCLLALHQHAWEEPLQSTAVMYKRAGSQTCFTEGSMELLTKHGQCWQDAGVEADLQEAVHTRHTSCYA